MTEIRTLPEWAPEELDERRRNILQATIICIAELGIDGATIKKIAEKAGVSSGLLLYYYHSKKELVAETMAMSARELHHRVDEATGYEFGFNRLRSIFEVTLKNSNAKQSPAGFWIELLSESLRNDEIRAQQIKSHNDSRLYLLRSVKSGMESGDLRGDLDPELVVDFISSISSGLRLMKAIYPEISPERAFEIANMALGLLQSSTPASREEKGGSK